MNVFSQSVATTGLVGGSDGAASSDSTVSSAAAGKSVNSIKDKEFSSVLDSQQQLQTTPAGVNVPVEPGLVPLAAGNGLAVDMASINLFSGSEDGNLLPLEGQSLPLADASVLGTAAEDLASLFTDPADSEALAAPGQKVDGASDTAPGLAATALLGESSPAAISTPVAGFSDGNSAMASTPASSPSVLAAATNPVSTAGAAAEMIARNASSQPVPTTARQAMPLASTETALSGDLPPVDARTPAGAATQSVLASPSAILAGLANKAMMDPANAAASTVAKAGGEVKAGLVDSAPVGINPLARADSAGQPATPAYQTAVPVEVGKPGWSDTVMERVMWMSSQKINKAEIALDPPELGPLQVRISTQGDHTSISFTSSHGVVRDALDHGLPRLRDMMESQGLNLADVDVSDQGLQQHARGDTEAQQDEAQADSAANTPSGLGADDTGEATQQHIRVAKAAGLVDHYV